MVVSDYSLVHHAEVAPGCHGGVSNGAGLSFNEVAGLIDGDAGDGVGAESTASARRLAYLLVPRALGHLDEAREQAEAVEPDRRRANVTNEDGVDPR